MNLLEKVWHLLDKGANPNSFLTPVPGGGINDKDARIARLYCY
jgi:hypothetical protein